MVLIVGALLFGRSLRNLVTVDPGFRQDGILAVNVDLRRSAVDPAAPQQALHADHGSRCARVRGVSRAAEAFIVPMSGSGWNQNVMIDGEQKEGNVNFNRVGPDYFQRRWTRRCSPGAPFGPEDRARRRRDRDRQRVVRQEATSAARNPIGRTFQIGWAAPATPSRTTRSSAWSRTPSTTTCARSSCRSATSRPRRRPSRRPFLDLIVRIGMPLSTLTPTLTRAIREVAPDATVSYETMTDLRPRLARHRAADGDALRVLRHSGDADRDDRALRRDVLHGVAPQGGDRDPDGARRRPAQRRPDGAAANPACCSSPAWSIGVGPGGRCVALGREPALRSQAVGSGVDSASPSPRSGSSACSPRGSRPAARRGSRRRSRCARNNSRASRALLEQEARRSGGFGSDSPELLSPVRKSNEL